MAKKIDKKGLSDERILALKNEILLSKKLIEEEVLPQMKEALQRYTGNHVPVFGSDWDIVLNEVYPIIQNNLPSIFFRNPRAFLKPRNKTFIVKRFNPETQRKEDVQVDSSKSARTQEDILNYIISQIGYKGETRKVLLDALLYKYGVMWHGYKGDFGMTEEDSINIKDESLFVQRIAPDRFLKDPTVNFANLEEAMWQGREIDVRLRDLKEDDKLFVDDKSIKKNLGFGNILGRNVVGEQGFDSSKPISMGSPLSSFADDKFKNSELAQFVKVQELYVRPTKKEKRDGKKGWIVLFAEGQKEPLRVNELTIKAEGMPGHVLQFNTLNDAMFPLADLDTYKAIADQKNVIINLQLRNAQENTKVWVGINKAGMDEDDITKIEQGENTIIMFDDDIPINNRMMVASPGAAASSELYRIDERIQRNLEDKSGVSDLKRGFLQSGEESATSVKIRSAGSSARPAYRQDIMKDFIQSSLHYLNQLNKQFMTVKEAVRVIGSLDLEWSEKPTKEELQADVDVEIDALSMLPENPEKELEEATKILGLITQAISDPNISNKILTEGKTFNLSPLIEQILRRNKIMDPKVFENIDQETSQGFVKVQQLEEARQNMAASIQGSEIPFPPSQEDDHRAKIGVYQTAAALLEISGQASDILTQLIQIHQQLIAEAESREASPGRKLPGPSAVSI